MKGNFHIRFGERGGETRWPQGRKVRSAPTLRSGKFLYIAQRQLLDLQKEAIAFAESNGLPEIPLTVGPDQIYGIEKNPYAHELVQVTVWIGYLQWRLENGFAHAKALDDFRTGWLHSIDGQVGVTVTEKAANRCTLANLYNALTRTARNTKAGSATPACGRAARIGISFRWRGSKRWTISIPGWIRQCWRPMAGRITCQRRGFWSDC